MAKEEELKLLKFLSKGSTLVGTILATAFDHELSRIGSLVLAGTSIIFKLIEEESRWSDLDECSPAKVSANFLSRSLLLTSTIVDVVYKGDTPSPLHISLNTVWFAFTLLDLSPFTDRNNSKPDKRTTKDQDLVQFSFFSKLLSLVSTYLDITYDDPGTRSASALLSGMSLCIKSQEEWTRWKNYNELSRLKAATNIVGRLFMTILTTVNLFYNGDTPPLARIALSLLWLGTSLLDISPLADRKIKPTYERLATHEDGDEANRVYPVALRLL